MYCVFSTSWKGANARKDGEGDAGASSSRLDAAGAPFQLALREPCVGAPGRRDVLVMRQHHGGRHSYQRHEHKALKIHNTLWAGLSVGDGGGAGDISPHTAQRVVFFPPADEAADPRGHCLGQGKEMKGVPGGGGVE